MRLIDSDVLLEHIKKLECHAENKKYEQGLNDFLQCYLPQIIDNQPTAYDVEKVVEELEKLRTDAGNWSRDDDDYFSGKEYAYENAIDIVKKGGAS